MKCTRFAATLKNPKNSGCPRSIEGTTAAPQRTPPLPAAHRDTARTAARTGAPPTDATMLRPASSPPDSGWGRILDARMGLAGLSAAATAVETKWLAVPLGRRAERVRAPPRAAERAARGGGDARRGARYVPVPAAPRSRSRSRPRPADDAPEFPLTRRTDVIARRLDAKTTTTDCRAVDGAEVARAFAAALDAVGLGGLGAARVRVARHFAQAGVSAGERARVTVLFISWSFEAAPQLVFRVEGSAIGVADEALVFPPWGSVSATVTHDVDAWTDASRELPLFRVDDATRAAAAELGACRVAAADGGAAPRRATAPPPAWQRLQRALGRDAEESFAVRFSAALVSVADDFGVDLHLEESPQDHDLLRARAPRGPGGG